MRNCSSRILRDALAKCAIAICLLPANSSAGILVVDLIPKSWSDETHQDSEANITVNSANPLQIAASAFTLDTPILSTMQKAYAPIFVSNDGGKTWQLNFILPSTVGNKRPTGDITLRFASRSGVLYAGILRADGNNQYPMALLRTENFLGPAPMTVLLTRAGEDQPYLEAITVAGGSSTGNDRVYVGHNNASSGASIDFSLDAASSALNAGFNSVSINSRPSGTKPPNGPQIRPAIHTRGVVYAVFYAFRSVTSSGGVPIATTDVVVVRDDNGASGSTQFRDLVDSDKLPGKRVVEGIQVPWINPSTASGQDRMVGDLAITVDPNDARRVFVVYSSGTKVQDYTLHIAASVDSGMTWSQDLKILPRAKNPGIAINNAGTVGLLYQQLTGTGSNQRWITGLLRTKDDFKTTFGDLILADGDSSHPVRTLPPYLGDYENLLAIGKDFYGIFCTSNESKFPAGVTFLRTRDPKTKRLRNFLDTADVAASIDPFFFKVGE